MKERDDEREARREFATASSEASFRAWQQEFYLLWQGWNADHFGDRLKPPHIGFGRTPPRSLVTCSRTTDYGALIQLTLHEGLVFGTNPLWVVAPMAEGHRRAVADLFLRLTVQQYVIEVLCADEQRYYGCGPLFLREANRVGVALGLPPVIFDRSGVMDADLPICRGWPHNVRPEGYYGADITRELLDRLTHPPKSRATSRPVPPTLGTWGLIAFLLAAGRHDAVRDMAVGQIDRLRARQASYPVFGRFEAGDEEEDGTPLSVHPEIDRRWLAWNGGTVRHIAQGIHAYRQYTELPILADALEEAGCEDGVILRHLRARTRSHDARCWVLKALLD